MHGHFVVCGAIIVCQLTVDNIPVPFIEGLLWHSNIEQMLHVGITYAYKRLPHEFSCGLKSL